MVCDCTNCTTLSICFMCTHNTWFAASLLVLRWKRAQGTLALADQSLNKALSTSAGESQLSQCVHYDTYCLIIITIIVSNTCNFTVIHSV